MKLFRKIFPYLLFSMNLLFLVFSQTSLALDEDLPFSEAVLRPCGKLYAPDFLVVQDRNRGPLSMKPPSNEEDFITAYENGQFVCSSFAAAVGGTENLFLLSEDREFPVDFPPPEEGFLWGRLFRAYNENLNNDSLNFGIHKLKVPEKFSYIVVSSLMAVKGLPGWYYIPHKVDFMPNPYTLLPQESNNVANLVRISPLIKHRLKTWGLPDSPYFGLPMFSNESSIYLPSLKSLANSGTLPDFRRKRKPEGI